MPTLDFKFLCNHMIDLGDTAQYQIPCQMREQPTARGNATMPFFDLGKVHKVPLKDERPRIPKKLEGMSTAYHEKLCDGAYERAAEAKKYNDAVRGRVHAYVASGVLEVVSDPFEGMEEIEGLQDIVDLLPEPAPEVPDGTIGLPAGNTEKPKEKAKPKA